MAFKRMVISLPEEMILLVDQLVKYCRLTSRSELMRYLINKEAADSEIFKGESYKKWYEGLNKKLLESKIE